MKRRNSVETRVHNYIGNKILVMLWRFKRSIKRNSESWIMMKIQLKIDL